MAIQKDALHRDVKYMMRAATELHKIVSLEDGSRYHFSACVLCNWSWVPNIGTSDFVDIPLLTVTVF